LTYLLFLKMADEYSHPPYKRNTGMPTAHNFGRGKQHLSALATLNILSLLFHTLLELLDQKYKLLRSHWPTRKTFLMICGR
jgi:hypothetical protein